jgi:hypothetical protein
MAEVFVVFISPSRRLPGFCLYEDTTLLSKSFPFHHSSYHLTLVLILKALLNDPQTQVTPVYDVE